MTKIANLDQIAVKPLREQILDALRDAILHGEFKPGDPLIESELAAQLGVSRAPLREAIQVLSAEGLVETIPYHGTSVRALTKKDIEEIYSLRAALESFAVERIITRNNAQDIENLCQIYDDMLSAAEQADWKRISWQDQIFHNTMIELSDHKLLLSTWNVLALRVQQVMALVNKSNNNIVQIAHNHLPIIEAIIAADTQTATDLIQRHAASAATLILEGWELPYPEESVDA
ncbi:GntR family transcriptional regulator [Chloroflexota bacterium]